MCHWWRTGACAQRGCKPLGVMHSPHEWELSVVWHAVQLRANARKAGQEYLDKAFMHGRFPSALPRSLTARSGQLTPQQQYVYDDFARIPRTAPKEGEALRSRQIMCTRTESAPGMRPLGSKGTVTSVHVVLQGCNIARFAGLKAGLGIQPARRTIGTMQDSAVHRGPEMGSLSG